MNKVYSYIEVNGKSFIAPELKGEKLSVLTYLTCINGRHYLSVSGEIPKQPPEIECVGPINLKATENKELAEILAMHSEPIREVRNERSLEYPDIRDQIGAIMDEFQRRQDTGEKLSPELSTLLSRIAKTKSKLPKKNTDYGI